MIPPVLHMKKSQSEISESPKVTDGDDVKATPLFQVWDAETQATFSAALLINIRAQKQMSS